MSRTSPQVCLLLLYHLDAAPSDVRTDETTKTRQEAFNCGNPLGPRASGRFRREVDAPRVLWDPSSVKRLLNGVNKNYRFD